MIRPMIVAALANGNDAVGVIDTVSDEVTSGRERPTTQACSTSRNSTYTSARSNFSPWRIAYVNSCRGGTRTWPINFGAPPSRFRRTSLRAVAGQREPTRPNTLHRGDADEAERSLSVHGVDQAHGVVPVRERGHDHGSDHVHAQDHVNGPENLAELVTNGQARSCAFSAQRPLEGN